MEGTALISIGKSVAVRAQRLHQAVGAAGDRAIRARVESHGIGGRVVDVLDDVHLATVRPIGTHRPAT